MGEFICIYDIFTKLNFKQISSNIFLYYTAIG